MIPKKTIVLIGMMGVGKSVLGKHLSKKLAWPLVDLDQQIEKQEGLSIPEIFSKFGEAHFRVLEVAMVEKVMNGPQPIVLSLGGGAFIQEPIRQILLDKAIIVWLQTPAPEILRRIQKSPIERPLLDVADPLQKIEELLKVRTPIYALAHLHISSSGNSARKVIDYLMKALENKGIA